MGRHGGVIEGELYRKINRPRFSRGLSLFAFPYVLSGNAIRFSFLGLVVINNRATFSGVSGICSGMGNGGLPRGFLFLSAIVVSP